MKKEKGRKKCVEENLSKAFLTWASVYAPSSNQNLQRASAYRSVYTSA
jgi:hypothetical protein